jgi:hypothetical protein
MSNRYQKEPASHDGDLPRPPCTVPYHFTLLDQSEMLRFCCHGSQSVEPYTSLREQWTGPNYIEFRRKWHDSYWSNRGLCLGCPHHEENELLGKIVKDYLNEHQTSLRDIYEGPIENGSMTILASTSS